MLAVLTGASPLLSAQNDIAADDALSVVSSAPASQETSPVQTDSDASPLTNNDVLSVDADGPSSIEFAGDTQVATFSDNVIFRRGEIEILGDIARLERDVETGELIKITVEGDPARFSRTAENSAETITGNSASIVYYNEMVNSAQVSVVEFIGSASFNRGRTSFQCTQIKHIIESGATDSPGPCSGLLAPTQAEQPALQPDANPVPDNTEN